MHFIITFAHEHLEAGGAKVGARPTLENNSIWGGGIYPLLGGPFFRLEGTFSPSVVMLSCRSSCVKFLLMLRNF